MRCSLFDWKECFHLETKEVEDGCKKRREGRNVTSSVNHSFGLKDEDREMVAVRHWVSLTISFVGDGSKIQGALLGVQGFDGIRGIEASSRRITLGSISI